MNSRRALRVACAVVVAYAGSASAQGTIGVNASAGASTRVLPGTTVAVPILVDMSAAPAGASVSALQLSVGWGSNRLTLDSVKAGAFGTLSADLSTAAAGAATLALTSNGATASGTAATLFFTSSATNGGTHVLVSANVADDITGNDLLPVTQARSLDMCVAPIGSWGDVNGDNSVNIIDAQQIARHSVALSVANLSLLLGTGDVNNDGLINVIDAQQDARFALSLPAVARIGALLFTPPAVTSVSVSTLTSSIALGAPAQLIASPLAAGNLELSGCVPVTWASSSTANATVSSIGVVTGIATGATTITATAGGQSGQLPVNITAAPPVMTVTAGAAQNAVAGSPLSQPFTVLVKDAAGVPLPNVTVTWTIAQGTGTLTATTTTTAADGTASVTYTPTVFGANSIRARVLGTSASARFAAYGTPAGVQRTWIGGASGSPRAFAVASNWTGGAVPTAGEAIFIPPVAAANRPQLTADVALAGLFIDATSTLDIQGFTLTVNGVLDASGAITGTGAVIAGGTGTLSGKMPSLTIAGSRTATGVSTVNGNLSVDNALTIGVGTMTVTGNLTVNSLLTMQTATGALVINGNALFQGIDEAGSLTDGTLEVKGNFTQAGGNGSNFGFNQRAFHANGSHLTRFTGTALQSITIGASTIGQSRFQNVQFANSGSGIAISNTPSLSIGGTLTVTTAGPITGTQVDVYGQVTTSANSSLAGLPLLVIMGAGPIFPQIAGIAPTTTMIGNVVTVSQTTTLGGNLAVNSTLDLGGQQLTVTGNLTVSTLLVMQNPADKLVVLGNALFQGIDELGSLTNGTLEVKGNFAQAGGNGSNFGANQRAFHANGGHLTRFTGTAQQTITIGAASVAQSRFQNVEFANTGAGIAIVSTPSLSMGGTLTVTTAGPITGTQVDVYGQVTTSANSSLAGLPLLVIMGAGTIFPQIAGAPPVTTIIGNTVTVSQPTTLGGNLAVNSTLDLGGQQLTVTGDLTVNTLLVMENAADRLTVQGNALFQGIDENGFLTNGTLELKGNLTQSGGNGSNFGSNQNAFRTTGSHLTRFTGTTPQTISIGASNNSRFQNLRVDAGASITFGSAATVAGNADNFGSLTVPSSQSLSIVGALSLFAGSTTTRNGSLTFGSCSNSGGVVSGFSCP